MISQQYNRTMENILHPQKPYTFECQFPKDMFFGLCDGLLNNSGLNLEIQYRRPIPGFIDTCDITSKEKR